MKKLTPLLFLLFTSTFLFSQNKDKALENVETYIKAKATGQKYSRVKVHEFFEQQSAESLPLKEKPSAPIKYSLSLTYKLGDLLIDFSYFHLDKDLNVVATSTKDEMMVLSVLEDEAFLAMALNPDKSVAIDSSETSSTEKLKNKKFKRQVTYEKDGIVFIYDYSYFSKMIDEKFLSSNIMFPSGSPFKAYGETLRKNMDTCKASSISFNALSEKINTEETKEFTTFLIYELNRKDLTKGNIKIADAKTNTEFKNIVKKVKTVRFPQFTRLVTLYQTEDGKEIDKFQFDDYALKNVRE